MSRRVHRPADAPGRENLTWHERWKGEDKGLIACWEAGRALREREDYAGLVRRVESGELPPLTWKGGVEKTLKVKEKYGCLSYLAQWQGMRGEALDIDRSDEPMLTCTRTDMRVTFTGAVEKYQKG